MQEIEISKKYACQNTVAMEKSKCLDQEKPPPLLSGQQSQSLEISAYYTLLFITEQEKLLSERQSSTPYEAELTSGHDAEAKAN